MYAFVVTQPKTLAEGFQRQQWENMGFAAEGNKEAVKKKSQRVPPKQTYSSDPGERYAWERKKEEEKEQNGQD